MSGWGPQKTGPGSSDSTSQHSKDEQRISTELNVLNPIVPPVPSSPPPGSSTFFSSSTSSTVTPHIPASPNPAYSRRGTPSILTYKSDQSSGDAGRSSQTESRPLYSSHIHSKNGRSRSSHHTGTRSHHGTGSRSTHGPGTQSGHGGGMSHTHSNLSAAPSMPPYNNRSPMQNNLSMLCSAGPIILFPLGCLVILIAFIILAIISPASMSPSGGGFGVASILPIPAAILLVISLFITSRTIRRRREIIRVLQEQERERERSYREREREKQKQRADRERKRRKQMLEEGDEGEDGDEEGWEAGARSRGDSGYHRGRSRSNPHVEAMSGRSRSGSRGSVPGHSHTPPPMPRTLPPVAMSSPSKLPDFPVDRSYV
ncbi:hypothetical protein BJ684DRAFT_21685 [Piptocephalis cylindrospora]|uniref:Uncharacterized protein n=1 Tax=Piptocephalis cylindrospora TaxID=1907219 RepID=A0A4P9XZC9_9FUNG|nr:hypothetical protein BJ684DRAFT_21685 [Piptocephalis cylindrospora]|eukprot:RKP11734.1 hypothetical protein BJ684DRAFT_21685 [Piptocephalis cylindrospora]